MTSSPGSGTVQRRSGASRRRRGLTAAARRASPARRRNRPFSTSETRISSSRECRRSRYRIRRRAGFVTSDGRRPRWRPALARAMGTRMARTDFRTPRLYVEAPLAEGAEVKLDPQQTNYLLNVLRLGADASVLLLNGRDVEFASALAATSRKGASLIVGRRTRPQEAPPDVDYLFAPLKHARLDYMAQKAVEMGGRRLRPVITRHTQVARVNLERLRANAIEALGQGGGVLFS